MKRTLVKFMILVFSIFFYGTAQASIISGPYQIVSGTHQLSNGNYVDLSGLEWLSLYATLEDYRTEDVLNASYNGHSDWRYATRAEAEILLDSLWGGVSEGLDASNFAGADWFMKNFGSLNSGIGPDYESTFFYGSDEDIAALEGDGDTLIGRVSIEYYIGDEFFQDLGKFSDQLGLSTGLTPDNIVRKGWSWDYELSASLLVRSPNQTPPTPNPEPTTLLLLGAGLLGASLTKMRKKNNSV